MTAKYWTTTGEDMWVLKERRVFDFTNTETGEVVSLDNVTEVKDKKFLPWIRPEIKTTKVKTPKVKKKRHSKTKSYKKSKYKGVTPQPSGKFRAHYWDAAKGKVIGLGTFESELQAAAAVEEALGNTKEAMRLLKESREGGPPVEHRRMFSEDMPQSGEFPSEE